MMLVVAVNLVIPICIAVFVYKDAKNAGMEPILWALVAALIPSFIGLIIYLIVRSGHSAWHCARCGAPVEEQYAVCPQCGAALKSVVHPAVVMCSPIGIFALTAAPTCPVIKRLLS